MLSGELAHRVWAFWGRDVSESRGKRRKIINKVAQAYEAGESTPRRLTTRLTGRISYLK
jgi:hypothetical protein